MLPACMAVASPQQKANCLYVCMLVWWNASDKKNGNRIVGCSAFSEIRFNLIIFTVMCFNVSITMYVYACLCMAEYAVICVLIISNCNI